MICCHGKTAAMIRRCNIPELHYPWRIAKFTPQFESSDFHAVIFPLVRIVIVEDHLMFREFLRTFCVKELGARVAGVAGSGRDAMNVIRKNQPNYLLLDINLPDGDGFEVAQYTKERWPSIRVLMLSSHCDDYTLFRVEQSGADGFVDKGTQSVNMLGRAFAALSRGEKFYSKTYLDAQRARMSDQHFSKILSEQERAVLTLIGQSLSDEEIAERLGISPTTAQTHRSHILRKLNIANSLKLVQYALVHGFTPLVTQRNGQPVIS
jgi:DNA-binding NarL/FixJ family response regulator